MKNLKFIIIGAALTLFFASCEKEEIEKTATNAMAGEWYVTYDAIDADGEVVYSDPFGYGTFLLDTYNVTDDNTTEMWIDDHYNSFAFKNRISVDLNTLTFSADSAADIYYDDIAHITNGKILLDAATTPSGSVADSIVFDVWFAGDGYAGDYWDRIRISGFRYTGFTTDD